MTKKLFLGIAIGLLFVYLSFKGVDLDGIAGGLKKTEKCWMFLVAFLLFLIQVLRAYRWGVILKPIKEIDPFSLFSVTSVGFMAVVAIPARIGELARPYLISTRSGISMSSALGTIFVERIFDGLSVLFIFFIVVFFIPLPPWLIKGAFIFLFVVLISLAIMIFLFLRKKATLTILSYLPKRLPDRWKQRLEILVEKLIDGFKIISHPKPMVSLAILSLLIWIIDAAAMYTLFFAFGFDLPPSAAVILMVVVILGIAIPTAPGFVGNWHFFCVLGLGLFGIHKTDALTYAIVLHFLSIGVIIVLGMAFLPFNRFSISDIKGRFSRKQDS